MRRAVVWASCIQLALLYVTFAKAGHESFYDDDSWSLAGGRWGELQKRQGLIPFPRVGRSASAHDLNPDDLIPLDTDSTASGGWAFLLLPYKRRSNTFTPRIGRKRRSVGRPDDGVHKEDGGSSRSRQAAWADLDWSYSPLSRQLVPVIRNGRGTFVPRLGKRRSLGSGYGDEIDSGWDTSLEVASYMDDPKRGSFTPRIGRGAFTPRIGRTPFTPRIGRSSGNQEKNSDGDDKSTPRSSSSSSGVQGNAV